MTTNRPIGDDLLVDDPGAWSIVSFVREAQGARIMGRGGHRRRATSAGLLSDVLPGVPIEHPGLDASLDTVGAGLIQLVSSTREGARRLYFEEDGTVLRGVAPRVIRRYSVPDLDPGPHEYPDTDPAADLSLPYPPGALVEPVPGEVTAPGGRLVAAPLKEGRLFGLAFLRTSDRALVRFIGGAACAAWTDDGSLLAVGGDWGVLLAKAADRPT